MNKKAIADRQLDNICVLCCRKVTIYAVGECDHPVCYQCATRMRVLCKQNDCAICRKELPKMIFCNERIPYRELHDMHFTLKDSKHKLYFLDLDIQKSYFKLLENRCQFCDNQPTYASFHSLKEHVRKEHERHFCDLCIEHLMIFPFERKCYTRADLARHRRIGDIDDTSHRGHPLCEFCDARYLDEDELYKHLRREHFYCHFCDADGFHHYYSDYEYLREHFRKEHFLCEEDDCIHEKFTTVFRTEIDLKAHRSITHIKNLSKAQMKQARTLELEFTIAPRSQPQRGGGHSRGDRDRDRDRSDRDGDRGGDREEHRGGQGGRRGNRRGESRDDNRNKRRNEELETAAPQPAVPQPSPKIDMNDSQAFPSLNHLLDGVSGSEASGGAVASGGPSLSDTMAQKLAKINRFSFGKRNVNGDEEFPALGPSTNPVSVTNSKHKGSWGTSASVLLTSSAAPSGTSNVTKKTLTLKLNSKEEFPGLQTKNSRPSSVSFHMTHNVKPASSNDSSSANVSKAKKNDERGITSASQHNSHSTPQPIVTRVTSTQNITFVGPSSTSAKIAASSKESNPTDDNNKIGSSENNESNNGVTKTDSGWYVLKKGKCSKTEDPIAGGIPNKDDFPELEKTQVKMRFREAPVTVQTASNAWKVSSSTSDADTESQKKSSNKKKQKGQSVATSGENGKKKKKATPSTFEKLKKLVETHSRDLLLDEDLEDVDSVNGITGEKAEKLSQNNDYVVNEKSCSETEEWPAIVESFVKKPLPPPGFHKVENNILKPPPGFNSSVAKPPPGFRSPLSMLNNGKSQTSVTFTNSSGEDFTLTSVTDSNSTEFMQLPEFNIRNKQLLAKITQALGGDDDKFKKFVERSARFRRSEISAKEYYEICVEMLGKEQFASISAELLVLLPDITKQQELLSVYKEVRCRIANEKSNNPFVVCESCQQVLDSRDVQYHQQKHHQ